MNHLPGQLPEFEVWRERQRELLGEAEGRRLAREVGGRRRPSVTMHGLVPGLAEVVRWFAVRDGSAAVVRRGRRCEE